MLSGWKTRGSTPTILQTSQAYPPGASPAICPENPGRNLVIGIGPVKLADYLDQSNIVTRTSDNQLVKAEYDRWVGSFKDGFVNVLADNIGFLLATDRIYLYPWRGAVPIDYQVVMDVIRCDSRVGEAAWLEARWSVLGGPEKKLLKTSRPAFANR
jgi:hypothetical protein